MLLSVCVYCAPLARICVPYDDHSLAGTHNTTQLQTIPLQRYSALLIGIWVFIYYAMRATRSKGLKVPLIIRGRHGRDIVRMTGHTNYTGVATALLLLLLLLHFLYLISIFVLLPPAVVSSFCATFNSTLRLLRRVHRWELKEDSPSPTTLLFPPRVVQL